MEDLANPVKTSRQFGYDQGSNWGDLTMTSWPEPNEQNDYLAEHVQLVRSSFRHRLKRDLWELPPDDFEAAKAIYYAPTIVVSHGPEADPIFNYGNLAAQKLFEMSWAELTCLPSRQSAEPPNQEERALLLKAVTTQGFIEHYSGIRIAKTGRRFRIKDVIVWNLHDQQGQYAGQAAVYSQWEFL